MKRNFALGMTLAAMWTVSPALAADVCFPLEWNVRNATDVPYEVEISAAKLEKLVGAAKGCGWQVVATTPTGARQLETTVFAGKAPETLRLRFRVPAGATALSCVAVGQASPVETAALDNLFAGALAPENLGRWELPKTVTAKAIDGGVNFRNTAGSAWVSYTVDIPEGLAGRPVVQEFDLTSHTRLAWGGKLHIVQLDADGKELLDTVADPRWTSHMRPKNKFTRYRDEGRIHLRAKKLRVQLELRRSERRFDDYGMPITDAEVVIPDLDLTHLAVRPAAELPFPKWNDGFFADGVSGKTGDAALVLGGTDQHGLFYQIVSLGGWSNNKQYRVEEDRFFPAGDGTVEAWFRPDDWAKIPEKAKRDFVPLFQANQDYRARERLSGKGEMLGLAYSPARGTFRVTMKDWKLNAYKGESPKVDFPSGTWTHLALQWSCKGAAELYVNGQKVYELAIPAFEALPLADTSIKYINDIWAMEFYLGVTAWGSRLKSGFFADGEPSGFAGAADELRVSTGRRYAGAFEPAKDFTVDGATRALFKFDRAFDGVSGGGYGFIPACVNAKTDRVEHRLADGYYWAKEVLPENDYAKVLDVKNFPNLPTAAEFREARVTKTKTATMKTGDTLAFTASDRAYPEYVEYSNRGGQAPVAYPILVAKGRLDPRSFGDLADAMGLDALTDREKANRIFQYVINASDYFHNISTMFPPGSDVPQMACYEAVQMLNSYCGFNCGPLNNLAANMFSTVGGCPASQTGGYGHSFEQVFYDGKNHIYDLSAQKFFPAMDNETAAYLKEAADQTGVHHRTGGSPSHFTRMCSRVCEAQSPAYQEKVGAVLNPGETYRVYFANDGQSVNLWTTSVMKILDTCDYTDVVGAAKGKGREPVRRIDRLFPQYSTGVITFDGVPSAENPAFTNVTAESFCYHMRSPNPVVWAEYAAYLKAGGTAELEVSTDFGKTYHALPRTAAGVAALEYRVKSRQDYLIRVKAPIAAVARFSACTEGMVNARSYPSWAKGGRNELVYKAVSGPAVEVTVAWREPAKEIVVKGASYSGAIPGFEREIFLLDPKGKLELEVAGVSSKAVAKACGRVTAALAGGKLTVAADPTAAPAVKRGVDSPEKAKADTYFAWVDIVDGAAVKRLTFVIAPDARLVTAADAKALGKDAAFKAADATSVQDRIVLSGKDSRVSFPYAKLPAGKYCVFALVRFPTDAMIPQSISTYEAKKTVVMLHHPAGEKENLPVASPINGCVEYYKAPFGRPGEPSRWKWDATMVPRKIGIAASSGWLFHQMDFPETDHLDFSLVTELGHGVEVAAVFVVKEPDLEFRLDLRRFLNGLNSDPVSVK